MLRLSIVVPHQDDDARLETTLLSLLENRTRDQEVIVVHNGSYSDPYQLGSDEVLFVEAPKSYTLVDQINLAVSACCARQVEVLFPGTTVSCGWAEEALELLQSTDTTCVGIPCEIETEGTIVYGLDRSSLPRRKILKTNQDVVPILNGTVFRNRVLQLIGGLYSGVTREGAELELQLLLQAMELDTACLTTPRLRADFRSAVGTERGYETGRQSGLIASAYGNVEGSGVTSETLGKQLKHLASALMNPKSVAERLGWVMGSRDRSHDEAIRARLLTAAANLDRAIEEDRSIESVRRAA